MALETVIVHRAKRQNDDDDDDDVPDGAFISVPKDFSTVIDDNDNAGPPGFSTITSTDEHEKPVFSRIDPTDTGLWEVTTTEEPTSEDTGLWGEETLWPKPTTTEDWPINSSDLSTMSSETVITEESTITGGMVTKTDSGQTVTVPNDEVVTVTRHTVVVTGKPPPLPTGTTFTTSGIPASSLPGGETTQAPENGDGGGVSADNGGGGLGTGALVGISVGGAIVIALFVLVGFGLKRRRRKNQEEHDTARPSDYDRDQDLEEKHFPEQMTPHTTGTQAEDPFAPFGGRADRSEEAAGALQAPTHVFEMDATSTAPVELPTISPGANPRPRSAPLEGQDANAGDEFTSRDPRANLNSLGTEGGEPRYVNHWNEYRAMGAS